MLATYGDRASSHDVPRSGSGVFILQGGGETPVSLHVSDLGGGSLRSALRLLHRTIAPAPAFNLRLYGLIHSDSSEIACFVSARVVFRWNLPWTVIDVCPEHICQVNLPIPPPDLPSLSSPSFPFLLLLLLPIQLFSILKHNRAKSDYHWAVTTENTNTTTSVEFSFHRNFTLTGKVVCSATYI